MAALGVLLGVAAGPDAARPGSAHAEGPIDLSGVWRTSPDDSVVWEFVPDGRGGWFAYLRTDGARPAVGADQHRSYCAEFIDDRPDARVALSPLLEGESVRLDVENLIPKDDLVCRFFAVDTPGGVELQLLRVLYVPDDDQIVRLDAESGVALNRKSCDATTFSDEVRGRRPLALDLELALLSKDVYSARGSDIDGWERVTNKELERLGIDSARLRDRLSGFAAALYHNGAGQCVLAYAGSSLPWESPADWYANMRQALGASTLQYDQAVGLAGHLKDELAGSFVITGHSLGGGLASLAALFTDIPAVTFNAAGLHGLSSSRFGIDQSHATNGLVRRYSVQFEALTHLQEEIVVTALILPDAVGHHICVAPPRSDGLVRAFLDLAERVVMTQLLLHNVQIELHLIDAVIDAMRSGRRCV